MLKLVNGSHKALLIGGTVLVILVSLLVLPASIATPAGQSTGPVSDYQYSQNDVKVASSNDSHETTALSSSYTKRGEFTVRTNGEVELSQQITHTFDAETLEHLSTHTFSNTSYAIGTQLIEFEEYATYTSSGVIRVSRSQLVEKTNNGWVPVRPDEPIESCASPDELSYYSVETSSTHHYDVVLYGGGDDYLHGGLVEDYFSLNSWEFVGTEHTPNGEFATYGLVEGFSLYQSEEQALGPLIGYTRAKNSGHITYQITNTTTDLRNSGWADHHYNVIDSNVNFTSRYFGTLGDSTIINPFDTFTADYDYTVEYVEHPASEDSVTRPDWVYEAVDCHNSNGGNVTLP